MLMCRIKSRVMMEDTSESGELLVKDVMTRKIKNFRELEQPQKQFWSRIFCV